jgi:hypothetical protein
MRECIRLDLQHSIATLFHPSACTCATASFQQRHVSEISSNPFVGTLAKVSGDASMRSVAAAWLLGVFGQAPGCARAGLLAQLQGP